MLYLIVNGGLDGHVEMQKFLDHKLKFHNKKEIRVI